MSKALFAKYRVDQQAEKNGVPIKMEDVVFHVTRIYISRNQKWALAIDEATKFYEKTTEEQKLTETERFDKVLRRAFLRAGLVGWEGVTNLEGEPLDFNHENAEWFFSECPDLLDDLFGRANSRTSFLKQEEDDLKNLSPSSTTKEKKKSGT